MARRVMISLLLIGMLGLMSMSYRRWSENRAMATGDVFVDPSDQGAAPTALTQPARTIVYPPAKPSASAGSQDGLSSQIVTAPQSAAGTAVGKLAAPLAGQLVGQLAGPIAGPVAGQLVGLATHGAGLSSAGGAGYEPGRFQLYRQGGLTWRFDTATGQSCVLFATHAEWRRPQVYGHGCDNGATQ